MKLASQAASEHLQSIRGEARKLANTGRYNGWAAIEAELVSKGRTNAPNALADPVTRGKLNVICALARGAPRAW